MQGFWTLEECVCVHMHLFVHLKICSVCAWLTDGLCETPDYSLTGSGLGGCCDLNVKVSLTGSCV